VDHVRRTREAPSEDVWEAVEARWRDEAYTLDPATLAAQASTAQEVRDALLRLPGIYRSAVVLHDMEGLTVPQIARIHEVGLSAAKQRLHRGRMMLVTALAAGAERRAATRGVPMRCWDARTRVSDYLDDELDHRERRLLELHLQRCPTCPPLYSALIASRDALTRLRDADTVIPPSLSARLARASLTSTSFPRAPHAVDV
jgi:RNA polymerase sigma-70 factor (ECF subfamily)